MTKAKKRARKPRASKPPAKTTRELELELLEQGFAGWEARCRAQMASTEIERFPRGKGFKRAAFGYFGGKFNALGGLLAYFPPPSSKQIFVDVFTGSSVVPINYGNANNILNDIDDLIISFNRCLQGYVFKWMLEQYPDSGDAGWYRQEAEMYDAFKATVLSTVRSAKEYRRLIAVGTPVALAAAFFMANRNNFSNIYKDGFDNCVPRRKMYNMADCANLLDFFATCDVRVWNLDFRVLLEKARSEWTGGKHHTYFFYLDPHYLREQAYRAGTWTRKDLRDLAEGLAFMPHQWVMSNEDSPAVWHFFRHYYVKRVAWSYTAARNHTTGKRHELLISNWPLVRRDLPGQPAQPEGQDLRGFLKAC